MIAREKSLIHIHNSAKRLNKILLLLFLVIAILLFLKLFTFSFENPHIFLPKKETLPPSFPEYNYNRIGEGLFATEPETQSFPLPDIGQEILFLARSTRPDHTHSRGNYLVGLKNGKEKRLVKHDEILYLTYNENHLTFSEKSSPLWIKLQDTEKEKITLKIGLDLISDQGTKLFSATKEHVIKENSTPTVISEVLHPELVEGRNAFNEARWWPPDRLYDQYGGKEYHLCKGLERLDITGAPCLFIELGKTFVRKKGQWCEGNDEEYPLAKVKEINSFRMIFELWDPTGIETTLITFNRERIPPINVRMDDVFSQLRKRTSSSVSCRINNQAIILKVGDWLFHANKGWNIVKKSQEIDAILNFKVMGELFIFDTLENTDGNEFFCGVLFDPMRTEVQLVRLPISQMKPYKYSPLIKKRISSKILPPSSKEINAGSSKQKAHQRLLQKEDYEIFDE